MSVMQRTIVVQPEAGDEEYLFDRLSEDLKLSAAAWAGLAGDDERLTGWPWVDLDHDGKQVWAKAWSSHHKPPHRLLTLSLRELRDGSEWRSLIKLGALDYGEVIVFDTRDIRPMQAELAVEQMQRLLEFLTDYSCFDDDGRRANRSYVLNKNRVGRFVEFLESPPDVRRLPVVLISTTNADKEYVADRQYLAQRLQGLTHVICLNRRTQWRSDDLPLAHKCFDGAVRVYLPGYSRHDPPRLHPWWHKDKFVQTTADATNHEIVRFIFEKTLPRFRIHPAIPQLQRELNSHRQASRVQSTIEDLRRTMVQDQNELFDEFYADYQELEQARDDLEQENIRLEHERRRLLHLLNNQLNPEEISPPDSAPRLYLSRQALDLWDSLTNHERDELHNTLLSKLRQPDQRKSQSEARQAQNGPCAVFPRGKAPNGQRIIYTVEGDDVYVHEIFRVHADYDKALKAGISLADYQDFTELISSS